MRTGAPQLAGRLLGHLDAPPEAEGIALCVDRARHLDFARVVTSDLARARTPGAAIAAERDVELDVDSRWRELHFGGWEGDRKSVVEGTSVSVRVDLGGRRLIKKKKHRR